MQHWQKDAAGNVKIGPLVSFEMASAPMMVLIRLERAASEDQLQRGDFEPFQLVLTTAQARALAQAILRTADQVDAQPIGSPQ